MLRTRLILGTILVAALVGLCWLDYHASRPGIFLLPLAVVLSLAGAGELLAMWRHLQRAQPLPWVVYFGTLLTVLAAGVPVWLPANWSRSASICGLDWLALGLVGSLLLAMIGELRRYVGPGNATTSLALSCLAVLYVGGLVGFLVQLRLLGGAPWGDDGRWGMLAIISLIVTVKMSDIGQYTIGRLFGKRKLAPNISPGKTWEGAIGGIVFAIAAALLVSGWGSRGTADGMRIPPTDVIAISIFAIAVAIAGIIGDLGESLLKRDAGVKDSSTWLPGFGGVLDLLDSLLGAAPVAYVFWVLGFVGP